MNIQISNDSELNNAEEKRLSGAISLAIHGIQAHIVEVEVDIIKGLPGFSIVGLPDTSIRESKERIRSALENSGYEFPPKNYVVNLAPASFKKQGANFDLPIALSILHATGQIQSHPKMIPMVGELALDGRVKPVRGVISMAIALHKAGFSALILPYENRMEAVAIEGIRVYVVQTIHDVIEVLNGKRMPFTDKPKSMWFPEKEMDFSDVKGQETAKRALEIAAAGHHNVLLIGPPGAGKTMLARRIPGILPPLTRDQAIEVTMVHSAAGLLPEGHSLIEYPPFRSPHHTASDAALVGGGRVPSVGEVSLAHRGVLFLDEFVEFRSNVLQTLRQPLENGVITISRAGGTMTFPADFMLVASSNPCQCGFYFDPHIRCTCSLSKVKNYFGKIAGPILDRIDIEVLLQRVPYHDLMDVGSGESSEIIRGRVIEARKIQSKRFAGSKTPYNSRMTNREVREFCRLDESSEELLESAMKKMNLSARSFFRILKVARTIADLDFSEKIEKKHLLESISYKNLHRLYNL
ncbi:MAG: YifB family Mg chelatase-like AAA ATPase [Spirochaetes bacterium]|nr:YifB family Mg chelatase-like AAA ATPase [Spirochaetota bacterium]